MTRELHIVGFQVGRETYGVDITSLQEIVRVPEITAVPDAPEYMEGVINLRGKIVSVIDLRKRFGDKNAASTRRNRILVVEHKSRLCGLIVDSASEVLKIPASDVEPAGEGRGHHCDRPDDCARSIHGHDTSAPRSPPFPIYLSTSCRNLRPTHLQADYTRRERSSPGTFGHVDVITE